MKKKILVLVVAAIMTMPTLALSGCGCDLSGRHKIYEEGYFQYILVGENSRFPNKDNKAVVAIVGFTGLGQQQEVIDFPRVINKKEVRLIGYGPETTLLHGGGYYQLESANLKKVYIHDNIVTVYPEAFYYWIEKDISLDIMCSSVDVQKVAINFPVYSRVFIYKELYEQIKLRYEIRAEQNPSENYAPFENSFYRPANVAFLNNYSDEVNGGYYRLDNIESGVKGTSDCGKSRIKI